MDIFNCLITAYHALFQNRVRTFLTMLGVIIGVLAVILLISIGEGARQYIKKELEGIGSNILIVTSGKTNTGGGFHPPSAGTTHKITWEDTVAVKKRAKYVKNIAPIVIGSSKIKYGNLSRDSMILGITPEFESVRNLYVSVGNFINYEEVELRMKHAVIGWTLKKELFPGVNPLGKMITIGEARFRIIGIMEPKGNSLGMDIDDLVFIPLKTAQELFNIDDVFEILIEGINNEMLDETTNEVKKVLKRRHANKEDFTIQSQDAILSTMGSILTVMTGVLGGIAAISLLVGGIGIMNIMLVSVRERTREIGIRKACGATEGDILKQFLVESVTVSLIGGLIGIVSGWAISIVIQILFPYVPVVITNWSVITAFCFSTVVGVVSGVYPAYKASHLDPIDALRWE